MRILITGSTGFVGSYLIRELLDRGHDLRGVASAAPPLAFHRWPTWTPVLPAPF